ncbi:uncharacterized protein BDV14DRAFT_26536 [Aspergillus stella-maris]|uniref:uncharacterized protein n=1 Tax=Aspergillus stella-maris TaxID=1810926 RepID=UPI003CCDCE5C
MEAYDLFLLHDQVFLIQVTLIVCFMFIIGVQGKTVDGHHRTLGMSGLQSVLAACVDRRIAWLPMLVVSWFRVRDLRLFSRSSIGLVLGSSTFLASRSSHWRSALIISSYKTQQNLSILPVTPIKRRSQTRKKSHCGTMHALAYLFLFLLYQLNLLLCCWQWISSVFKPA